MIDTALSAVVARLNEDINRRFPDDTGSVVLSNITDLSRQSSESIFNKVVVSVINIQKDHAFLNREFKSPSAQSRAIISPPLHLNMFVVVASFFENDRYEHGLKLLSECADFVQANSVFSPANTPSMDPSIERLIWDIENLNLSEIHSLWGVMGSHYLPSLLYKVRAVRLSGNDALGREHATSVPEVLTGGR